MNDLDAHFSYEYHGETAPRSRWVATLLTVLHPSLGFLYVGQTRPAWIAALLSTATVALFMIVWSWLAFFPILPLAVIFVGWVVFDILALLDVLRVCDRHTEEYVLRGFNHPVVYALTYLFIGLVPLYGSYALATQVLWGMVQINDPSMNPALVQGDVVLVDRFAFSRRAPQRGELVVLRVGDESAGRSVVRLGRVLALEGDRVTVQGDSFEVNQKALLRKHYGESEKRKLRRTFVERNGERSYLIASTARSALRSSPLQDPIDVPKGQIFVATDNRAYSSKERTFWTASAEEVLGQPTFILYSSSSGALRFERIGWRIR